MKDVNVIIEKLKNELAEFNNRQEALRQKHGLLAPAYIAHGTHVSPEEFREKTNDDIAKQYPQSKNILPKFTKETQNELDIIKNFKKTHPQLDIIAGKDLQKMLEVPERVFGIPTKNELDDNKNPIPQDGSYAYAIKKASASINFTEEGIPLLIGTEDGYKPFEDGIQNGHIYIARGDHFKPEIDDDGKITEYTSQEHTPVLNHIEVSPTIAMQHNVQFVMFKTKQNAIDWYDSNKSKFNNTMNSNSERMLSLAKEVKSGRAAYINATLRGENPQIKILETAEKTKNRINNLRNRIGKADTKTPYKLQDVSKIDFINTLQEKKQNLHTQG